MVTCLQSGWAGGRSVHTGGNALSIISPTIFACGSVNALSTCLFESTAAWAAVSAESSASCTASPLMC